MIASGLHIVHGNAVTALRNGDIDILGHQVNLRGVMGAGIAKQIRAAYPNVYKIYREAVATREIGLANVQIVRVGPSRWIANIAAQSGVGMGTKQTDYGALRMALADLAEFIERTTLRVGLPYGIGCGLAGGDWGIVLRLIEECLPQAVLFHL